MTATIDQPSVRPVPAPGSISPPDAAPLAAGSGFVELARVNGRTEAVRLRAESPLRLFVPRKPSGNGTAAWVVAGSYGGGLVAGDRLGVTLRCGPGTATVLGTQASTKAFKATAGRRGRTGATCGQTLAATVGPNAVLVAWPDPVTCFAGSRYEQVQRFDLSASASLLAVDWLTSGRMARGERWAFDRYASRTSINIDGTLRLRDATLLEEADGPLDGVARAGGFDCLGSAWLVGPAFAAVAADLLARLARSPIDPRRDVQYAVSPAAHGGAVVRFAGRSTEATWRWLREQFAGTLAVVGIDPWSRRG